MPAEHAARAGGRYAYRAWHEDFLLDGSVRTATVPRDPAVARDLDDLLHATRRVPLTTPWYRVVVYTEDSALRHDLRVRGIDLGPRFSEDLAQQRRQFYTLEAKQSVAQARARMDALESAWATFSPTQQRRAYLDAEQTEEPTLWEQRLEAHTRLARRLQMIPQASQEADLPAHVVEVRRGRTTDVP